MKQRFVGLAVGLLLAAAALTAQTGQAARVPVTDANELASLGFPREAGNVFRWAAPPAAERPAALRPKETESWGPATGFTTLTPMALRAEHNSGLFREPERAYCPTGWGGFGLAQEALAEIQLPEGVALDYLQMWAYDDEPTDGLTATLYEFCAGVGFDPPTTTLVGELATLGSGGYTYDATPLYGYTVRNRDCGYSVRVRFIPGDQTCRNQQIQFRKVALLWHRQVGAPPVTATFSDVPTSHPFYPFVEALARSGITSGCGGGRFCPDQPLTRGQMAVFLAKGLGMGWQ